MVKTVLKPLVENSAASLAESVYETLLEAIVSGQLPPGAILSEVSVAKQLEVSRTPVHDALRQLAKDGLVEHETGRRARVANFTRDDVYEIFELRKFLEGPAAELAAKRMDARQLAPLRATADDLNRNKTAVNWTARWTDFDEAFHVAIAESSGNRRLAQEIERYRLVHRGFNKISTDAKSLRQALAEHYIILEALEAHDGAAARKAMTDHIAAWQDYFIRTFPR